MKKNNVPIFASINSYGTVHVIIGKKEYRYYGVDTALYSFINDYKPWKALNMIKKSAKRVETFNN